MTAKGVIAKLKPGSLAAFVATLAGWGVTSLIPSTGPSSGPYSALDQLLVQPAEARPSCNGKKCGSNNLCYHCGGDHRCYQEAGYCWDTNNCS